MVWSLGAENDSRLAQQAARGDSRAFVALYRSLHPTVARYVARRVSSEADAEDLVARVFRRFVENLPRFDADRGNPSAWIVTMARNAIIDHYRVTKNSVPLDKIVDGLHDGDDGPLQRMLDDERIESVRMLVQECSLDQRRLLSLRYGDGLTHRDIAELLGISEVAVRKRLSRTLAELRARRSRRFEPAKEVDYAT